MEWNDAKKVYPKSTYDLQDEIFIVSDGKNIGFAVWVNLCSEDSECGADQDEYDFKCLSGFIEINFWIGPVKKVYANYIHYFSNQ
jgi:hypothetical protein